MAVWSSQLRVDATSLNDINMNSLPNPTIASSKVQNITDDNIIGDDDLSLTLVKVTNSLPPGDEEEILVPDWLITNHVT